ncbi:MAG: LAGLIDADG family homing endonuclease [Nanoarchaeota archaeon]
MTYHISIPINEDTIYLMEAMKVEGYWKTCSYTLTIQNKDLPLLNHIEKIAKELGTKPAKRILLKIRLENETPKEDVRLLIDNKEINFHIEKNPFDKKKVKAVINLPFKNKYNIDLIVKNKEYKIKINSNKDKFIINGNVQSWAYGDLRFPVKKLLEFLDTYGGDKKLLHVSDIINSSEKLFISAFSALIDCEGSINWYGLKRELSIRMKSKDYLEEWSKLLNNHDIGNKYRKRGDLWEINISGWEDFRKLEKKGLKLYHSKKREKWIKMMRGFKRNQISRGSYRDFYVKRLKEYGKEVSAIDFSKYLNKSKRTLNHFLSKLEKEKLISSNRKHRPYLYFISTSSVR